MSHDELIRRAMLHATPSVARPGFAIGGNPGDLATGGFGTGISGQAATSGSMAAAVDRGNAMAAERAGGNGGANAAMRSPVNEAARRDYLTNAARADARLGPNAAQAMAGAGVQPDVANLGARTMNRMVAEAPSVSARPAAGLTTDDRALAEIRNLIAASPRMNPPSFSALTGTNAPISQSAALAANTPVNFNVADAAQMYQQSMPSKPMTLDAYMNPSRPQVGPMAEQSSNVAAKGDFLGTLADSQAIASGIPRPDTVALGQYARTPADATYVGATPPAAAAVAAAPSIGSIKAADYQALANSIKGYTPSQTNQLAFGSAYATKSPTEVGKMIEGLKVAASNPSLTEAQRAQLSKDIATLQDMGGIAISPGSSLAPTPKGFSVDPTTGAITKSPGFNVVAGPYASMPSPYGTFENISFAMPKSVALSRPGIAANPQFAQMPAATQVAQGPTNIVGPGFEQYGRGTPTGLAPSQVAAVQPSPAAIPAQAQAPQTVKEFVANILSAKQPGQFRGSLDERPGGDRREERASAYYQTRHLLELGYTQRQIAEMSPEERDAIIHGNAAPPEAPVVAATGGRINYADGGTTTTTTPSRKDDTKSKTPTETLTLQPLPAWNPTPLPQYTMPSASPMIANFVGSLNQPIPAVQTPQYQSMVSPLQNWEASFVNPAMGTSAGPTSWGVNALRYNPMLMDERPDYALVKNDSLSNALRLARG